MDVVVRKARLAPHIKCFAHMVYLATQAGVTEPHVSRSLGWVRLVAAFLHRSSAGIAMLTYKQKVLDLPSHKLIVDVATHWNSRLIWLSSISNCKWLWQQQDVQHTAYEIDILNSTGISDAEDIERLLKPLLPPALGMSLHAQCSDLHRSLICSHAPPRKCSSSRRF